MASSTAYWISGRSTIGSISFGTVLVVGRNLVPSPATGNTALRIRLLMSSWLAWRGKRLLYRLPRSPPPRDGTRATHHAGPGRWPTGRRPPPRRAGGPVPAAPVRRTPRGPPPGGSSDAPSGDSARRHG